MAEQPTAGILFRYSRIAVFAALIAAGAFLRIDIPISPVPITFQTFFVLLAGLLLPPWDALLAVAVYLIAGAVGIPVFAGGSGGFAVLMGPTGGFLMGFLPAALLASLIGGGGSHKNPTFIRIFLAVVSASLTIYALGYPWILLNLGWDWKVGLVNAVLPYLPGDILKALAAVAVAATGRKIFARHD